MPEEDRLWVGIIAHKGIFNLSDMTEFMYDWCMDEQYKVTEKKYQEVVVGDSKNIEMKWDCDRKVSDYFRARIKIKLNATGMKKIEVKRDGEKLVMNSGNLQIKLSALMFSDYEGRWSGLPFWKFFRGIYDRYIIRSRIEYMNKEAEEDLKEFIAQLKAFLNLESKKLG